MSSFLAVEVHATVRVRVNVTVNVRVNVRVRETCGPALASARGVSWLAPLRKSLSPS
ncbi:MAG: hypothetical protein NVSMB1_13920 [Polyangiales bacterium]